MRSRRSLMLAMSMEKTTSNPNREWPDLIAKTARGDQEAFSRLYDQSSPQIYGLILRMINHPQVAEEVTMDVYVQVWKQAQSYDVNRGTPMGWLVTIARTRAIDQLRSGKLRRPTMIDIEEIPHVASDRVTPEEQSSARQRAEISERHWPLFRSNNASLSYWHISMGIVRARSRRS